MMSTQSPASPQTARFAAFREFWYYFSVNRGAVLGLVVFALLILVAIFAPLLAPFSPDQQFRDAIRSADAVLLSNRLEALVQAFGLARRTRRIIIENLLWAGLYNGLMLPFAALGWITPIWAAVGMSISSLIVVLNALRLTRIRELPATAPIVDAAHPATA